MKRKLMTGMLIVIGTVVTLVNPLLSGLLAVGVWIYLIRMVRKQKTVGSNDGMEPKLNEWSLKRLKVLLVLAGFLFLVFMVSAVVHNGVHGLFEIKATVSLLIALVAIWMFVAASAGGLVVFLKGRSKHLIT